MRDFTVELSQYAYYVVVSTRGKVLERDLSFGTLLVNGKPAAVGDHFCAGDYLEISYRDPLEPQAKPVVKAERDGQGSLLCQSCRLPYPYAEPAEDGTFKCYGCKVEM